MGLFSSKNEGGLTFGFALAEALSSGSKPWYLSRYLVKLNLVLMMPLLSSASLGYDGSMMNGLQTLPQWKTFFGNPEGAILGMMNTYLIYISDRFGRKLPCLIGLVACVGFAIMQGLAQNPSTFVTVRAFLGFFTSFISQPSPVLIAELAYPTQRGKVTALYNTFFRIPSLLQGVIPAFQLFGLYFVPESPNSPLVKFEMDEIERAITEEARVLSATSWTDLIRTPANRKRTFIALIVGWFSQWNGVSVVSYYLVLVLNTIGIANVKHQTLINGLLQIFNWLAATFCGALMVDRLGRRTLFLLSGVGMLCSYIVWTGLTSAFVTSHSEVMGRAVAYTVEIYPYTLRGRGLSFTLITSSVGLIVGNQVNPIAMKEIGGKHYIVFFCLLTFLLILVWFFFPETKGHTLKKTRDVFEGKLELSVIEKKKEVWGLSKVRAFVAGRHLCLG
ncbi:general substrate transporter [Daldinia eschscholtzii]|nr:general substrate transporter [Daldinia eschscholtzii]